jgi:hypothetical protein
MTTYPMSTSSACLTSWSTPTGTYFRSLRSEVSGSPVLADGFPGHSYLGRCLRRKRPLHNANRRSANNSIDHQVLIDRAASRTDQTSRASRHPLGNRWWRKRSGSTADASRVGAADPRQMRGSRGAVLLQAMGWTNPQIKRPHARWSYLGRGASDHRESP